MATQSVPFHFLCGDHLLFTYNHDLSTHLIGTPHDHRHFLDATDPITKSHNAECTAATGPNCIFCTMPNTNVIHVTVSFLESDEPCVRAYDFPICDKATCAFDSKKKTQETLQEPNQHYACEVCDKVEGAMRCARCRVVAYCGKECQKKDWKKHKGVCRSAGYHYLDL